MSSKSERDNRSNQLNPNNSSYYSSRGQSGDDDDSDAGGYVSSERSYVTRVDPQSVESVRRFELDLVSDRGHLARLFTMAESVPSQVIVIMGDFFWAQIKRHQESWQSQVVYAQLHDEYRSESGRFLRRPDNAGIAMSDASGVALSHIRQARAENRPRSLGVNLPASQRLCIARHGTEEDRELLRIQLETEGEVETSFDRHVASMIQRLLLRR